jgi:hypothetical protein
MGLGFHEAALAMPLPEGFAEAARASVAASGAPDNGRSQPQTIADAFKIIIDLVMATPAAPEERAALAAFIGEIDAMRKSIEQRVGARKSARVANLSCQHAEAYSACRVALDKLRDLQQTRGLANGRLNDLTRELGDARAAFGTVQNSKPPNSAFPSDHELASWGRSLAVAQQQFDVVETEYREAKVCAVTAQREFEEAVQELEALKEREASLRGQLSGQPQAFGMAPRSEFPFLRSGENAGKGE